MQRILLLAALFISVSLQAQTTWVVDSLNDSGFGSLRAAADSCSAGDTIRFNPNLIANGSDTIVLTSGEITIGDDSITVIGLFTTQDTLVISGNDSSRVFHFSGNGEAYLDSLVIQNGYSAFDGGAILSDGGSTFIANSLIRNSYSGQQGGGIWAYRIRIENSKFINNSSLGHGGGVRAHINAYLQSSFFLGNSGDDGAGIYVFNCRVLNIADCEFNGNIASGDGGGIGVNSEEHRVEIVNSVLKNNSAVDGGGIWIKAISNLISDGKLFLTNSTLSGNTASGNGGGVFSSNELTGSPTAGANSGVYINYSTLNNNSANGSGGGVYSYAQTTMQAHVGAYVNIYHSTVVSNSAGSGAGIYCATSNTASTADIFTSSNASVDVKNATITKNTMAALGGAIFVSGQCTDCTPVSSISTGSSIVLDNSGSVNDFYNSSSPTFVSNGYNIFDTNPSAAVATDQTSISLVQLNLQNLSFNGGSTQTLLPNPGSVAIDAGNASDTSRAQNAPVVGVRDVGATEGCYASPTNLTISACGEYVFPSGNRTVTQSGNYIDTIVTSCGADSLLFLDVTVNFAPSDTTYVTTCDSYTWIDGVTYYSSQDALRFYVPNAVGCDSVKVLYLTITNTVVESYTRCSSFTWRNGVTYTQSNNWAQDTVVQGTGCDNIYLLDLTITGGDTSTEVHTVCDSLTWINGVTYYSSIQNVRDTLANANGCDSVVTLDLTVNSSVNVIDTVSACLFYQWIDGQVYLSDNNTATQTFVGSNGCDSVVALDLDIHYGTVGVDTQLVCDSLVWIDGNTYYSDNSTATYTLIGGNSHGCDSVVTLNLTVNGSQSTDVITACDSLTWINGVTYYSSTHMVTDTFLNVLGCDSVVALDLTIKNSSSYVDVINTCDSLTWIDGVTYYSSNNIAAITFVNSVGCDSVVYLDLTISNATPYIDEITSCTPLTWLDGVTYTQSISGPTYTLINAQGCDSVVTLDFTLTQVDTSVVRNNYTLTANATNATFQWVNCESGVILGATQASYTVTANGTYQVEVTQNGCVDTSDCFSITNVGIGDVNLSQNIQIYPNPVHDQLNIEVTNWPTNGAAIVVRDITGKQVYTKEVEPISNKETLQINTTKWAKGTYFIEVSEGEHRVVEKIVVQ